MEKITCNICVENFNKPSRAKVVCQCDFEACRSCVKTYLLNQSDDAHCMSCKVKWNRKFLSDAFEKTFMTKQYKIHRENILFERELSMMPETQPYIENIIKIERLEDHKRELNEKVHILLREIHNVEEQICTERSGEIDITRREFIRQCPNGECKGFLSSNLKCSICEKWACGECREIKGATRDTEHVCNKEIVETIKMMEKDTKSCPRCSALIFKIEGCSQMWCTQCHTPFNWSTLKIETGVIHNPEYFEYLRKSGGTVPRTPGDIQCGREIDNYFLIRFSKLFPKDIVEIVRNVVHIREIEIPRYRSNDIVNGNRDLRINYMRNRIDKEQMKTMIYKREKDYQKKLEISNVLGMYVQCMTDIVYRLNEDKSNISKSITPLKLEMKNLRDYVNSCFENISKSYNSKLWNINNKYQFN